MNPSVSKPLLVFFLLLFAALGIAKEGDIQISYLEDKLQEFTKEEALQKIIETKSYTSLDLPQYSSSTYWFLISVKRKDFNLFQMDNQTVGNFKLWQIRNNKFLRQINSRINAHVPSFFIDHFDENDKLLIKCEFRDITVFKLLLKNYYKSAYDGPINFVTITLIFQGIVVGLIIYNISMIFFVKDSTLIYFTLYCIFFVISSITMSGNLSLFNLGVLAKFVSIFGAITITLSGMFLVSYLNAISYAAKATKFLYIVLILTVLVSFIAFIDRGQLSVLDIFFVSSAVIQLYLLFKGVIKKRRDAIVYFLSSTCIAFGLFVSIAANYGYIPVNILTQNSLNIGATLQMVVMSIGISYRINKSMKDSITRTRILNDELEWKVEDKTRDIKSMIESLEQGIMYITAEDDGIIILPGYSKYLHNLIDHEGDFGNADFIETILTNSSLSTDEIDQVKNTLIASIDDEYEFISNLHLLPRSFDIGNKNVEIDWSPVRNDKEIVEKILVAIRDVTQLKWLEKESLQKSYELEIVSAILKMKKNDFSSMIGSLNGMIAEGRRKINSYDKVSQPLINTLFINIHTIKGISRSMGLKSLADLAHKSEEVITSFGSSRTSLTKDVLLAVVQDLDDHLRIIESISNKIFNLEIDPKADDTEVIDDLIEDMVESFSQPKFGKPEEVLFRSYTFLLSSFFKNLFQTLDSVYVSAPKIAKQLGKPVPVVEINNAHEFYVDRQLAKALQNSFVHIMRNTLDHGLEDESVRFAKSKPVHGKIEIDVSRRGQELVLIVRDDGQGLDIEKLKDLLRIRGIEATDLLEVAKHIFDENVSTAKKVTEISGRGIGMAAVKSFLEENNCTIDIKLADELDENFFAILFVISIKKFYALSQGNVQKLAN